MPAEKKFKYANLTPSQVRTLPIEHRIRAFRERAGLSINAAANQTGISPGSWNDMEKKRANPTRETILKMASVLRIDPAELL